MLTSRRSTEVDTGVKEDMEVDTDVEEEYGGGHCHQGGVRRWTLTSRRSMEVEAGIKEEDGGGR